MKKNKGRFGLNFTEHSEERQYRRRITDNAVNCVLEYGDIFNAGHKDVGYWLSRESVATAGKDIDRYKGIAVIITEDNNVKTVMRCSKKPDHWKKLI